MLVQDKGKFPGRLSGFYPAGDWAETVTSIYGSKHLPLLTN